MRYSELKEAGDELATLQANVKAQVDRVADPAVLNKVASILRRGNIGNIARMAFKKDSDGAKFVERLGEIIVGLEVPIEDKIQFLREFGRTNMIKPDALFDGSGTPKSMNDWFEGSDMAKTVFKLMVNDHGLIGKAAGEAGPGEVAIACFHRDVVVGTDPKAGYDLKYGSDEIEVKAKATAGSGGGRWTAVNDDPLLTYAQSGESVLDPKKLPKSVAVSRGRSVPGIADILNDPQYLKDPNAPLSEDAQRKIFARLLKIAYANADDAVINDVAKNYPTPNARNVAPAAFESYKAKQQFTSMLLIKLGGDTVTSIHFTDLNAAIDQFTVGTLYLMGQQRGMSLQATLK
jgi:hypothetical protein